MLLLCRYTAGDHVAIYPENDITLVERIGELLKVDLNQIFSLVNKDGEYNIYNVCEIDRICVVKAF